jgi:hypothetical protein
VQDKKSNEINDLNNSLSAELAHPTPIGLVARKVRFCA